MRHEAFMARPDHCIRDVAAALMSAIVMLAASPGQAAPLPTAVGQCSGTTIERIGPRLQGQPGSGSGVLYVNGGTQVSYEVIAAVHRSRRGDRVRLCLVSIPKNCPPGDDRGRMYRATNLRTGESWTAPNAQHSCGGA
jgi:hypothetical protein